MALNYTLTDAQTGLPVRDLEPYLGAWGHTVILDEDGHDYVHSHPRTMISRATTNTHVASPPVITFDSYFPRPGRYRIWSQVQRHKTVSTVSFDLDISRLSAVAVWNGARWSALDTSNSNLNGSIRAIAVSGTHVYAGGDFTEVGSLRVNRVMKWDGRKWSALGEGVNGTVWAIATSGADVYIAGEFTTAGGVAANRIAKWDGRRWSPLSKGINDCKDATCSPAVYALAVSGIDLYVGGRFSTAGSTRANGIAKWSNNGWTSLGDGMQTGIYDGVVRALAIRNRSVYAGGRFKTAGSTIVNNIAQWDGANWRALDSGIGGGTEQVFALGVRGSELYAGGDFSVAGDIAVSNAAVWNGREWSGLGFHTDGAVQAVAVDGPNIFMAGSRFTLASGQVAQGIIKRNVNWSAVGDGIGYGKSLASVMALGITGNHIYAGGGPFALPNEESSAGLPTSATRSRQFFTATNHNR